MYFVMDKTCMTQAMQNQLDPLAVNSLAIPASKGGFFHPAG